MAKKTAEAPEPWERQEGEGPKPFEAFCIYRDMGIDRSIRKVGQRLDKSHALMSRWSAAWNWSDRVEQWDREQDRLNIIQQQKDIAKMRKNHAKIASAMLAKAAQAMAKMKPEDIKPQDVSRFVEVASKLERVSLGDVGEVVENRDGGETAPAVTFYIPENNRD